MVGPLSALSGPVAVVGCGGLGVPAAWTLAALGVPELVLVDDDVVELSNLHRQVLYGQADIGQPKTAVLARQLHGRYPRLVVTQRAGRIGTVTVNSLLDACTAVLEGSDDAAAKFAVNDWIVGDCQRCGVVAAAIGRRGQWMAVAAATACYRCIFEAPPPPESVATCSVAGVIGSTVGVVGSLAARSLGAVLVGAPDPALGALLRWTARGVLRTPVARAPDCICGGVA